MTSFALEHDSERHVLRQGVRSSTERMRRQVGTVEIYVSRPTMGRWAGSTSDGERVVVIDDGRVEQPGGRALREVDRDGRVWWTRSYCRSDVTGLAADIAAGLEVSGKRLRVACRVASGGLDGRSTETDLQRALRASGLRDSVVRTAAGSARTAVEHALALGALRDWPRAALAMGAALGHVCDALAARSDEIWPGSRWRLERLRAAAPSLEAVDTSVDELSSLLLFDGLDVAEPAGWFERSRSVIHRALAQFEEDDV